jgi:membrane-bound ClpP family serine protease
MRIRQARDAEQIAEELAPLAQALASLSDELAASIKMTEDSNARTISELRAQTQEAVALVATQAKLLQSTTERVETLVDQWGRARKRSLWETAIWCILAAQLSIGFWLLLAPVPQIPEVQNTLDAKAVADYLKPAITDALKRR